MSSSHAPRLCLTVRAGPTRALLTAFPRAAMVVLVMAAAVGLVLGDSRTIAGAATLETSVRSLAATGEVTIGHAGVLNFLVRDGLTPALAPRGITVKSAGGNTLTVARNIRTGALKADLFGAAEANANQLLTGDANGNKLRWFASFARNAIVVFYSPNSRFRAEFEKAARGEQPWYTPLTQDGIKIARSNPDEDPGGYLTLLVNQLGETFTGQPGLKHRILGEDRNPAQIITNQTETATKFANGEIDAIFGYQSFAISAGNPFLPLPPQINLSDPTHEAFYSTASFTNNQGETFRGGVIRPSMGPVDGALNPPAAQDVLDYLFSPDGKALIAAKNFLPGPLLFGGDLNAVPHELRRYIQGVFTRTTLTVTPPSPADANTTQTLTATVTPAAAGTVQFTDGDTPLGTVGITNGTASLTTRLPAGNHSLTARFTPTDPATATPSTSAPLPYLVKPASTTTTLTAAPNPTFQGIPTILIAQVTPFTATGTIHINDGATPLGAPVPVTAGFAILTTSTLTKGTHTLTATFTPNNPIAFNPSTSPPVPLTVRSLF